MKKFVVFSSLSLLLLLVPACGKKKHKEDAPSVTPVEVPEDGKKDQPKPDQKPEEKPADEKPADKPADPSPVTPTPLGHELFGLWSTPCVQEDGSSFKVSWNFKSNGKWTYDASTYIGSDCQTLFDAQVITGDYVVGKRLTNGSVELDLSYFGLPVMWLVYKQEGNTLKMSYACDEEDIMDVTYDYCYGRPAPVGYSADTRSVDLPNVGFIKQ